VFILHFDLGGSLGLAPRAQFSADASTKPLPSIIAYIFLDLFSLEYIKIQNVKHVEQGDDNNHHDRLYLIPFSVGPKALIFYMLHL